MCPAVSSTMWGSPLRELPLNTPWILLIDQGFFSHHLEPLHGRSVCRELSSWCWYLECKQSRCRSRSPCNSRQTCRTWLLRPLSTTFSAPPFCLSLLEYISLSSLTTVTPFEVLTHKKCNFPLSKKYTYVSYLDIYTIWTQIANRSVAHRKGIYRICKHQKLNRWGLILWFGLALAWRTRT